MLVYGHPLQQIFITLFVQLWRITKFAAGSAVVVLLLYLSNKLLVLLLMTLVAAVILSAKAR